MRMAKLIVAFALILLIMPHAFAQERGEGTCAYLFYLEWCPNCSAVEKHISEEIAPKYPNFNLKRIEANENSELLFGLYDKYNVPEESWSWVPIVFIGDKYMYGKSGIILNLEEEVKDCELKGGCECPSAEGAGAFEGGVSIAQLAGLAVVDAVNPCELAVLIILMTAILSRFPGQKRKALKAGLAFSAAVFLMYIAFGLLLMLGFKSLLGFTRLGGSWLYTLLGGAAILLGLLNIKDAVWYGGGGFIMEVPQAWRPRMKEIIKGTTSVWGAFVVGIIVSFFLTPCTAGPYVVAAGILSNLGWLEALPYLLFYMLIFIAPMIVITLIVYFGFMAVEDMEGWRQKNIKRLHWVAGLLLLGLGIAMVLGII